MKNGHAEKVDAYSELAIGTIRKTFMKNFWGGTGSKIPAMPTQKRRKRLTHAANGSFYKATIK
jgi:hypothetical protein